MHALYKTKVEEYTLGLLVYTRKVFNAWAFLIETAPAKLWDTS